MRLKIAILSAAAIGLALPASADPYRDRGYGYGYGYDSEFCRNDARKNETAGAVVGGIIGGLAGRGLASRNTRTEGAVLGAVVGAVAGSQIAKGDRDCRNDYAYGDHSYGQYGQYGYGRDYDRGYGYDGYGHDGYGYERDSHIRMRQYRDDRSHVYDDHVLAGGRHGSYSRDRSYYSGRDCRIVEQVTRLPDGTRVNRPVEACWSDRHGDWVVD
jgi:hypothetical protein